MYFSLYKKVEKTLWKNKFWRKYLGITTPILEGRWAGEVRSFDRDGKQSRSAPVHLSIMQSWRNISISVSSNRHKSSSQGCSIRLEADGYIIRYTYFAIKKYKFTPLEDDSLNEHFSHVGNARIYVPITESGCVENRLIKMQFYTENLDRGSMHLTKTKNWNAELQGESDSVKEYLESHSEMEAKDFTALDGEQDGADQPATAPESKSEGEKKPKPESEGRSQ